MHDLATCDKLTSGTHYMTLYECVSACARVLMCAWIYLCICMCVCVSA